MASSGVCLGSGFERSYGDCTGALLFNGSARLTGTAFVVGNARGGFGIFAMVARGGVLVLEIGCVGCLQSSKVKLSRFSGRA